MEEICIKSIRFPRGVTIVDVPALNVTWMYLRAISKQLFLEDSV